MRPRADISLPFWALASAAVLMFVAVVGTNRTLTKLFYVAADGVTRGARFRWLYAVPILLGLLAVLVTPSALRDVRGCRWWWVPVVLLLADVVVILIVVVGIGRWPEYVARLAAPLAALGALGVGLAFAQRDRRLVDWTVAAAAITNALVALLQMIQRNGFSTRPGRWLAGWDRQVAKVVGSQFTFGRADGLDVNPNSLSMLALLCLTWSLFAMPKGKLRDATTVCSLLVIGLAQSRTAVIAAAALALLALWALIARHEKLPLIARSAGLFLLATALVAVVVYLLLAGQSAQQLRSRLGSGAAVVTQGAGADRNLSVRVELWKKALAAYPERPLGFFDKLSARIGTTLDNEYIYRLMYGGPLWLLAFLALLVWLAAFLRPKEAPLLGPALALVVAVAGVTQLATQTEPFVILGWMCVGAGMALVACSQDRPAPDAGVA